MKTVNLKVVFRMVTLLSVNTEQLDMPNVIMFASLSAEVKIIKYNEESYRVFININVKDSIVTSVPDVFRGFLSVY